MAQYLERAASLGRDAVSTSMKAGSMVVEKAVEVNQSIISGNARFFEQPDEKIEEVRALLDNKAASKKLEGMKRLIALISTGRDMSKFFPDVVKNVVATSFEVRKLVYIYLVRYAEQEPDLALLSINTFQKDLSDSNQFIRALSLRVMSGIRIEVIVPIVVMAVKKCAGDMSPYVRKTAAHAIPKIFNLDPTQGPALVDTIETLLSERSTMAIGSVVMAFLEVCPDRLDMIHQRYRQLCGQLLDTDEWGQIAIMTLLLRYARTQFVNPNSGDDEHAEAKDRAFYSDDEDGDADKPPKESTLSQYSMEPDHRLLLTATAPLLNSRNAGVVMAVAMIYWHLAPRSEVGRVVKPLVRLLGVHREIDYAVLANIATMAAERPALFEPHIKRFFVRHGDPGYIRKLKLEILTSLATESNINVILRELQTYLRTADKLFVTAAIQALGRCAINVPDVADKCLAGLMRLVNDQNDMIVAESVVVIKQLLQLKAADHVDMIKSLARALKNITVPDARASIIWLIGEYAELVPTIAPDVLRQLAQTFVTEDDIVKLQVVTLAAKLYLAGMDRSDILMPYVFSLAKYDLNYDVRDRARLLRILILNEEGRVAALHETAKSLLFAEKSVPTAELFATGRERFSVGSMSHLLNSVVEGYQELPDFATENADSSMRDVVDTNWKAQADEPLIVKKSKKSKAPKAGKTKDALESFLDEDGDDEDDEDDEDEDDEDEDDEDDEDDDEDDEDEEDDDEEDEEEEDDDDDEDEDEDDEDEDESEDDDEPAPAPAKKAAPAPAPSAAIKKPTTPVPVPAPTAAAASGGAPRPKGSPMSPPQPAPVAAAAAVKGKKADTSAGAASTKPAAPVKQASLLDFDDIETSAGTAPMAASVSSLSSDLLGLTLTPATTSTSASGTAAATGTGSATGADNIVASVPLPSIRYVIYPLLNHLTGKGLQAEYTFGRRTSLYPDRMVSLQIILTNKGTSAIEKISMGNVTAEPNVEVLPFSQIDKLEPGASAEAIVNIDFKDKNKAVKFELHRVILFLTDAVSTDKGTFPVTLDPPVGELMVPQPISLTAARALQKKLSGMYEASTMLADIEWRPKVLVKRVLLAANAAPLADYSVVATADELVFSAQMLSTKQPVIISLKGKSKVAVNCEDMVLCPTILKAVKLSVTAK